MTAKLDYERHRREGDEGLKRASISPARFGALTIAMTVIVNALGILLVVASEVAALGFPSILLLFVVGPLPNMLIFIGAIIAANEVCGDEPIRPYALYAVLVPLVGISTMLGLLAAISLG